MQPIPNKSIESYYEYVKLLENLAPNERADRCASLQNTLNEEAQRREKEIRELRNLQAKVADLASKNFPRTINMFAPFQGTQELKFIFGDRTLLITSINLSDSTLKVCHIKQALYRLGVPDSKRLIGNGHILGDNANLTSIPNLQGMHFHIV